MAKEVSPIRGPVSFVQEREWRRFREDPLDRRQNMYRCYRLNDGVGDHLITAAVSESVRRHGGLRARFGEDEGGIYQEIIHDAAQSIEIIDRFEIEDQIDFGMIKDWCRAPFDLEKAPVWRAGIFRYSGQRIFAFSVSHIVWDAASWDIFLEDIVGQIDTSEQSERDGEHRSYIDFAIEERTRYRGLSLTNAHQHYRQIVLDGAIPDRMDISKSLNGSEYPGSDVRKCELSIGRKTLLIADVCASLAIAAALSTNKRYIYIHVPITTRTARDMKTTGFFINLLPMLFLVDINASIADVAKLARRNVRTALRLRATPELYRAIPQDIDDSGASSGYERQLTINWGGDNLSQREQTLGEPISFGQASVNGDLTIFREGGRFSPKLILYARAGLLDSEGIGAWGSLISRVLALIQSAADISVTSLREREQEEVNGDG